MPSAIVVTRSRRCAVPAFIDGSRQAAPSACTPTMRTVGARWCRAVAMPEIRPPPPTGTTTVSASGQSSAISRPTVPCPAMTSGWSKGLANTAPVASARSWARAMASSTVSPARITSAP